MILSFISATILIYAAILLRIFYRLEDPTTKRVVNKVKDVLHISRKQTAM